MKKIMYTPVDPRFTILKYVRFTYHVVEGCGGRGGGGAGKQSYIGIFSDDDKERGDVFYGWHAPLNTSCSEVK